MCESILSRQDTPLVCYVVVVVFLVFVVVVFFLCLVMLRYFTCSK